MTTPTTESQRLEWKSSWRDDHLKWVCAFAKIGFFQSEAELTYHDEVNGDLFTQAQQTLDLLYAKYFKAAISYEDIVRIERYPVPRPAFREALLNALIHRDYMIPAPIQIRVYDHKLMLWNPATLPEGWTEDTLLSHHTSQPYNPDIANAFFRAGEIEAWGRGIERIFVACREAGTPAPRFRFIGSAMLTEFIFSDEYLQTINGVAQPTDDSKTPVESDGKNEGRNEGKTPIKMRVETQKALLDLLRGQPTLSLADAARVLGKSTVTLERIAKKLREEDRLRHVGSKKGGHWEVLE